MKQNKMNTTPRFHIIPAILGLLFIIVFLVGIWAINNNQDIRSRASTTGVALSFSPSTINGVLNTGYSFNILMNTNGKTVSAAELYITYDPAAVTVINVTPGTYLPKILSAASVKNGIISLILGASPEAPKKGSGVLATINVKPIAKTSTALTFKTTTAIAAIEATTNTVGTTTGANIVFAGSPTNTSTPTNTTTKAPTATPKRTSIPTKAPMATPKRTSIPTNAPTATPKLTSIPTNAPTQSPVDTTQTPVSNQTKTITKPQSTLVKTTPTNIFTQITTFFTQIMQVLKNILQKPS